MADDKDQEGVESVEVTLEELTKMMADSEGYVVAVGYLTPQKDAKGHKIIQFVYRRYQFSIEDAKKLVEKLPAMYEHDKATST